MTVFLLTAAAHINQKGRKRKIDTVCNLTSNSCLEHRTGGTGRGLLLL